MHVTRDLGWVSMSPCARPRVLHVHVHVHVHVPPMQAGSRAAEQGPSGPAAPGSAAAPSSPPLPLVEYVGAFLRRLPRTCQHT